jgi:hypothetical protein
MEGICHLIIKFDSIFPDLEKVIPCRGVAGFPIISSGNSLIILEKYRFMLICTSFFDEKSKFIPT